MPKMPENNESRISYEFQNRLTELIEEQDCSKYEFASSIGVGKETILRSTLYGIIPTTRTLIKIADGLKVSFNYLLGGNKDDFYPSDHPTTFQVRLKQLTEEKHTTYSKIAREMPFTRNYFFDWIREGTLPSLDYLMALSKYFDVSMDYLLGRTDERHN